MSDRRRDHRDPSIGSQEMRPGAQAGSTSIGEAIADARLRGLERLDAQLLVAHRLGVERSWLIAHADALLARADAAACRVAFERRADGVPLAYLVGEREFHGLRVAVTPAVLDPRPDTETLVEWALALLDDAPRCVVDLGTGSGAIALAVKQARPNAELHATDISGAALQVARDNARRLGLTVAFAEGDWWDAVPGLRFDLALANPPYIAADDPHLMALRHEPRHALTPGPRGLEAIERIVAGASGRLKPGGWLIVEHGFDQELAVRDCFARHGLADPATRCDLAGRPRCTAAQHRG